MTERAIKPKGGTEAQNDNYIGEAREVTVDTDNNTLRVHDGVTSGGHVPGGGDNSRVPPASGQSLAANSETQIAIGTPSFDTGGQWDIANDRFVAATDGVYLVTFKAAVAGSVDGEFQARITVNNTANYADSTRGYLHGTDATATGASVLAQKPIQLSAGDTVMFAVENKMGSSIDLLTSPFESYISVIDR